VQEAISLQKKTGSNRKRRNQLNDLCGKDWIKFTKTWFVLRSSARDSKIRHPASFPEKLAEAFIAFFTKSGEWVLDPFFGTGSSLVAAKILGRSGIGVELYPKYVEIARNRLRKIPDNGSEIVVLEGDSRSLDEIFEEEGLSNADFCITSPPYWNQLNRNHKRQRQRARLGLDTDYGSMPGDLGAIDDYNSFLEQQKLVFDAVFRVMKKWGYLVVVTNNVYFDSRIWPLAFDTFRSLSEKWVPKDERIWCQDDKALFPFGIFDTYIGNRAHHYCLIFRKET